MKSPTTAQERPKFSYLRERAFVGGRWVEAGTRARMAVHNPATGTHLGDVPDCGGKETAEAIEAAKAAFPAWKARTAKERAAVLRRLADCIEKGSDQLAALLTAEQGKSLTEARGEIASSAAYVRWFAEEAQRVYGDVIPSPWSGRRILVTREPVGVVGAITPSKFSGHRDYGMVAGPSPMNAPAVAASSTGRLTGDAP